MATQTVETPSAGAQPGRECTKCRRFKSIDEFYWDSGRERPRAQCCDCENAYRRAWRARYARPRQDLWTSEEIATLRRARDAVEAAELTGRTPSACRQKALDFFIRLPGRRPTRAWSKWADTPLEAAIIEAAGKRISYSAIAKRHGITKNTVAGIVWRWRKRRGG